METSSIVIIVIAAIIVFWLYNTYSELAVLPRKPCSNIYYFMIYKWMSAYSESIGSGASTWRLPALFIELTTPLASMSSIMRAARL